MPTEVPSCRSRPGQTSVSASTSTSRKASRSRVATRTRRREIAARTVNKERARHGEAKESSRLSREDISSGRRGGLPSRKGPGGRTRDQLYEEAKHKGIKGRSKMTKAELERAVGRS